MNVLKQTTPSVPTCRKGDFSWIVPLLLMSIGSWLPGSAAGWAAEPHKRTGAVLEGRSTVTVFNATPLEPISDTLDAERLGLADFVTGRYGDIAVKPPIPGGLLDATAVKPDAPLAPIRLVGTRNAVTSGQVVIAGKQAISHVVARLDPLLHENSGTTIAAEHATIHFAVRRSQQAIARDIFHKHVTGPFEDFPAGGRPHYMSASSRVAHSPEWPFHDVYEPGPRAGEQVHPVWIELMIPAEAIPGTYRSELHLSIAQEHEVRVPVTLQVAGWRMPDTEDWKTHVGLIQSPESVARLYEVPLWSDEHFEKLEPSLRLIGQTGNKVVYIPLVSTHIVGNEHTMVKWVPRPDGSHTPDFSVVERYLDLYEQYHGAPSVVLLMVGEGSFEPGYRQRPDRRRREPPELPDTMRVSTIDPATGVIGHTEIPFPGLPGSHEYWGPAVEGMRERVTRRGWDREAVMLGLPSDYWPRPAIINFYKEVAPGTKWAMYTHGRGFGSPDAQGSFLVGKAQMEVGYWVVPWPTKHHKDGLNRGWASSFLTGASGRVFLSPNLEPAGWHVFAEAYTGGSRGYRGIDRMMADFWPVLQFRDGHVPMQNVHSQGWGRLVKTTPQYVLGMGTEGAVPTVRYQMLREGIQISEARIFIEQALEDEHQRAHLGDDLALRAQQMLKDRHENYLRGRPGLNPMGRQVRDGLRGMPEDYATSPFQDLTLRLYQIAAEVAAALDGVPQPPLARQAKARPPRSE